MDMLDLKLTPLLVPLAKRLVHQHELWIKGEDAGKRDELLPTGPALTIRTEPDHAERPLDPGRLTTASRVCKLL
ncbi:hypothetical protein H8B02_43980 [Bradyrhizobium sp. Pear77]|uniref:hypothetical protein n=1 Tax=Bradyrhizobium altum TaxID=1571202 RepID=UPI001E61A8A0|nr:hypothetical protein [Bradyrhizobium altum]MCC8960119.1 hypothetical protein [Bradyrhizobium altum]